MKRTLLSTLLLLTLSSCYNHEDASLVNSLPELKENVEHIKNDYRKSLINHDFDKLEGMQKQANIKYIKGEISAAKYSAAFDDYFYQRDMGTLWLDEAFEQLEASNSDSAYRLLNLGIYYQHKGFQVRGTGWASTVSRYNVNQMWRYFSIAYGYFYQALEKDNTIISAYQNIIRMAKHEAENESDIYIENVFSQGIAIKPDNYALTMNVLYSQLPRWGGSYEKMEQTIQDMKPYFDNTPQDYLKLRGLMLHDKYADFIDKVNDEKALKQLLPFQTIMSWYLQLDLAQIYRNRSEWNKCYQHAKLAVLQSPYEPKSQSVYGYCAFQNERWDDAIVAMSNYLRVKGIDAWGLYFLAYSYLMKNQPDIAYPLFKESILLRPSYRQYAYEYLKQIESEHPDKTTKTLDNVYQELRLID